MVAHLYNRSNAGDPCYEGQRLVFIMRRVQDVERRMEALTNAINAASEGSDRLGQKLVILNVVLAAATVVGAAATVVAALK